MLLKKNILSGQPAIRCITLTVVTVVEDQELAPAEFIDECQHDVTEAHRRSGSQRVASSISAGLQGAGGAR